MSIKFNCPNCDAENIAQGPPPEALVLPHDSAIGIKNCAKCHLPLIKVDELDWRVVQEKDLNWLPQEIVDLILAKMESGLTPAERNEYITKFGTPEKKLETALNQQKQANN